MPPQVFPPSHSSEETMNFASNLASQLHVGDVVVLTGELGAGKTKFTEGFLRYFGLAEQISSPTFNIVNEYKKDDINIYHFDVYRLEDVSEFYAIGGEEYFSLKERWIVKILFEISWDNWKIYLEY